MKYNNLSTCVLFDSHSAHSAKGQGHNLFHMDDYVDTHIKTNASMFQIRDINQKLSKSFYCTCLMTLTFGFVPLS